MNLIALSLVCLIFCLRLAYSHRLSSNLFIVSPLFFVNCRVCLASVFEFAVLLVLLPGALIPAAVRIDLLALAVSHIVEP